MIAAIRRSLTPAGHPFPPRQLAALLSGAGRSEAPEARLASLLPGRELTLCSSGRDALARAYALAAARTGRDEIVVPAYTCYSVAAAAVAAGLRVRLVDVDAAGRIDLSALAALPLDRAAAVVVCNLFGVPEELRPVADLCERAGALSIDDAAQSIGGTIGEERVGARGDLGILSFGRGKPLAALGGGALVVKGELAELAAASRPDVRDKAGGAAWKSFSRALAYDLALSPTVFGFLLAIPRLQIGETVFDPGFPRGPIDPAARAILRVALGAFAAQRGVRVRVALDLARRIASGSDFEPVLATPPESGVYPRLGVIAPDAGARAAALAQLAAAGSGATGLYPRALSEVSELAMHRAGDGPCPGAEDLARRVLTLPTHGRLVGRARDACLAALRGARRAPAGRVAQASE